VCRERPRNVSFALHWCRATALAEALVGRAVLRVETTATAALAGGDGSHMAVEDAVSNKSAEVVPRTSWARSYRAGSFSR
jgi:hypothetical protein